MKRSVLLVSAILVAGCAVGPDYVKPELATPPGWSSTAQGVNPAAPELTRWWQAFGDPALDRLVERALAANLDLRLAEARLLEARAARGVVAAAQWPRVDARGGAQRLRDNAPPAPPDGIVTSWFQGGFDAGWELDLFGGVRRSVEAADADLGAAAEERRAVLVSVLGEVARGYVELRGLRNE